MADESEDYFIHSPKRLKLDIEPNLCDSRISSVNISSDIHFGGEETTFTGGSSVSQDGGIDEEKRARTADFSNSGSSSSSSSSEDEDDDVSSTVSNVSDISLLSNISGQQWKPVSGLIGSMSWLEKLMMSGVSPRFVLSQLTGDAADHSENVSDLALWKVIFSYLCEPARRPRLSEVNTLDHAIQLIRDSKKIMVLTGAGVSVSCGIPDFRSKDGVYARLAVDFPNLPDPQAMFDISFFRQDPRPFFKFAREMYPGQFRPSPSHKFIKMIERHKKLLRNYTQNIDTLERVAGIENVIECHGSFATASCTLCGHNVPSEEIKETVFEQKIPYCTQCSTKHDADSQKGIMKPDIVFFGEGLPDTFHDAMAADKDVCDLLIVMGSSLKVRPVALIPNSLPKSVPQILINRERLPYMNFDVELLGDSDVIVDHLCRQLGEDWSEICWRETPLTDGSTMLPNFSAEASDPTSSDEEGEEGAVGQSHRTGDDSSPVRCQKIGPRHDPTDETSRHVSFDSSRDSGIGESSNNSNDRCLSPTTTTTETTPTGRPSSPPSLQQPLDRENCFYCIKKRRYVFPGAEVSDIPGFPSSSEE